MTVKRHPNFLIIGAAKSGTTSLHNYLAQHPNIFMSDPKEPGFFAARELKHPMKGPGDSRLQKLAYLHPDDYLGLFSAATSQSAIGESSTIYLYSESAAEQIADFYPDMKIIVILRNPVDRAYSQYCQRFASGTEPLTRFEDALAAEPERIKNGWHPIWHYSRRGHYCEQLKRYFKHFATHDIRVNLFEDLKQHGDQLVRDTLDFLAVDANYPIDTATQHNATPFIPRSSSLTRFMARPTQFTRAIELLTPRKILTNAKQGLRRFNRRSKPPMSEEARANLQKRFRQEIVELQDLIDRDLSHWLYPNCSSGVR